MNTILHIQASPRPESFSTRLAEAFLQALKAEHSGMEVDCLDVFNDEIPEFRAPQAAAKYAVMAGQVPQDKEQKAWKPVVAAIERFKAADAYIISCGMWNFGVPYRLKQYIDVIVQPGLTFAYSHDTGYSGLVTGRPMILAMARGGEYGQASTPADGDFTTPYLKSIFEFIGFTDIRTLVVEPTLTNGPDAAQWAMTNAAEQAKAMARELLTPASA